VTDGAKIITWLIRKNTANEALRTIFEEVQLAMWVPAHRIAAEEGFGYMHETVRTVDAEELAELQAAKSDVVTEEMSRAALKAAADAVHMVTGKWYDNQSDDLEELPIYTIGHGPDEEG